MVADVLAIDPRQVLVVDVREDHLTLDILQRTAELLRRLSAIAGVGITDEPRSIPTAFSE